MPWFLPLLLASACIQFVEFTNRRADTWSSALPVTLIPIVISQWGLYYGWRHAPAMLTAWAVFTLTNAMLRAFVTSWAVGEHFTYLTPLGIAVMFAGQVLVREGMKAHQ